MTLDLEMNEVVVEALLADHFRELCVAPAWILSDFKWLDVILLAIALIIRRVSLTGLRLFIRLSDFDIE